MLRLRRNVLTSPVSTFKHFISRNFNMKGQQVPNALVSLDVPQERADAVELAIASSFTSFPCRIDRWREGQQVRIRTEFSIPLEAKDEVQKKLNNLEEDWRLGGVRVRLCDIDLTPVLAMPNGS